MQKIEEAGALPKEVQTTGKKLCTFDVGICVTGEAAGLPSLVRTVLAEEPEGFALQKVVIVASACSPSTISEARRLAASEPTVQLIEHETREGKANAINEIVRLGDSDLLVFVNADAAPDPASISRILRSIGGDRELGVVSGRPVFESEGGLTSLVLDVMWTAHNINSFRLNMRGQGNHGTDELMVVRRDLLDELPEGLVNDGAYISGRVREQGFRAGFEPDATVRIDVPKRMADLIVQRRRILYGHMQVKKLVGKAPSTVETLMFFRPAEGFRILIQTLAGRPKLLLSLPVAAVSEIVAFGGALYDSATSDRSHAVWRRYAV